MMKTIQLDVMRPAITVKDAEHIFKYFTGIDEILGSRFELGFLPDEEHITSILAELLDERGSLLHHLPYSINQLNADLKSNGGLIQASMRIQATKYTRHQEANLTYADLGIIIEYKDAIKPELNFMKGILFQAKKLYPVNGTEYGLDSSYKAFDAKQHNRLVKLAQWYSEQNEESEVENASSDCLQYMLYNPPLDSLAYSKDRDRILHTLISQSQWSLADTFDSRFDYLQALRPKTAATLSKIATLVMPLYTTHELVEQRANEPHKPHRAGSTSPPFTLRSVLEKVNIYRHSLPWFIVLEMLLGSNFCNNPTWLSLVMGSQISFDEATRIVPRYVIHFTLQAGTSQG